MNQTKRKILTIHTGFFDDCFIDIAGKEIPAILSVEHT